MEKIINFFEQKAKIILGFSVFVCLSHFAICIFKGFELFEALFGLGLSIALFFLTWGIIFVVLGFQKINPFCPKSVFKFFCYFFIVLSVIGVVGAIFNDLILSLIKSKDEMMAISQAQMPLASVYAIIFLYRKTFGKNGEIAQNQKEVSEKKKISVKYVALIAVSLVVALVFCFSVFSSFKNSEPYLHSIKLIEENAEVQEYLGENYKLPIFVSGSMSTSANGTGFASISYSLKGKNGKSRVYVEAQKENDIWFYKKVIFYKTKGSSDCVDLLLFF